MYTFDENTRVQELASSFYKTGKITAILCHATCILLKATLDGKLLVEGKTWTGFANSEEIFADSYVGKRIQPFWIEDEASCRRRISLSPAASRRMPSAMEIGSQASNSFPERRWLDL